LYKKKPKPTTGAITVEALLDSAGSSDKTKEQRVESYLQAFRVIKEKDKKERFKTSTL
jgi:hypothetical protein